ncbi:enoyl-[acyl-carrier protein] reductase II [Oscillibacter sp. PC13]|nr:enoyl-[acyl-carrier protein] reductase II [Oscillibacter sp. PC13]
MRMRTRLTELLNIRYPILQGAMYAISTPDLVSAVSNAGGAGILTDAWDLEQLRENIRKIKKLTDQPFGVNLNMAGRFADRVWQSARVIAEEHVPFVTTGAGDPRPYIPMLKDAGVKVLSIAPNTRLAKRMEAAGVDGIIVEGMESGGHIGTMTTMSLMTNVIPEVEIPVVAAGGIADGRGLAAALAMGAAGVQIGSRFLLASECGSFHPKNVAKIIAADDEACITIGTTRGKGMRGLRSAFSEKYLEMELAGVPTEELNKFAANMTPTIAREGISEDGMNGMVMVGQSVEPLKKVQTAAEIVEEIMARAEETLKKITSMSLENE